MVFSFKINAMHNFIFFTQEKILNLAHTLAKIKQHKITNTIFIQIDQHAIKNQSTPICQKKSYLPTYWKT